MVFLCCRTLGLRDSEAEEVANETFWAAYRAWDSFREESQISTWLWGIAYRRAVSYLRKYRKRAALSLDAFPPQTYVSSASSPSAMFGQLLATVTQQLDAHIQALLTSDRFSPIPGGGGWAIVLSLAIAGVIWLTDWLESAA
ncbi:MAG: hypothetical protein FWD53_06750 [Phycisphaerales bacterium]|nr:hypothetical protein [Phycisphaerales bacterium]